MNHELTNILFEAGCIKISPNKPFTYASGKQGPIYCDTRKLIGLTDAREAFLSALMQKVEALTPNVDYIGAMATGAIPLGAILADRLGLPFFYVRSEAKGHGKRNLIEGLSINKILSPKNKCLLFEDLINSGGSLLKGLKALDEIPLDLVHIVSIVNYDFEIARKNLEKYGKLSSLVGYSDILAWAKRKNVTGHEKLVSWHESFYNN